MDCCLVLTTLSGVTLNVSLSIAKFDRLADLEDHVMDYLVLLAQKHGTHAVSSELSSCRPQSLAFLTTHFEAVNCSIVSLPLVAASLATKLLMSAAHCSGSIPLKELPIGLAASPSLGITSLEAASTLPNLPCKRVPPQASCRRNPLPGNWP